MKCSAITGPVFEQHNREGHVENHDRLLAIVRDLPEDIPVIAPVPAAREDIERVHQTGYLSWLRGQCRQHMAYTGITDSPYAGGYLQENTYVPGFIDRNTYINPRSYEVATFAAGSAIAAMERTLAGESCFALVRPPGHHAAAAWAMGFCLLNNAAIAAAKALDAVDRVAIVDWDVHHGNGTQDIFYTDDRVLYCSVHQDDIFPHTGLPGETGTGAGTGYTVNAPLPRGSVIGDYTHVFLGVFLPVLGRFRPDLVIVSAGQDLLSDDPVGGMMMLPSDMGYLTGLVLDATSLPLTLVLEGGYGPSQPEAIRHIFSAIAGRREERDMPAPGKKTRDLVDRLRKLHHVPPGYG
jgi:acetoin utilization deacetylase AcuC-like enzyme